jgi:putative transposase
VGCTSTRSIRTPLCAPPRWFASDFVTQIEWWISQYLLGLLARGGGADHARPRRGTDRIGRRAKRFLSPSQKYEIWLQLLRQETTISEAADRLEVLATSKPGTQPTRRDLELEAARAVAARLDGIIDVAVDDPARPVLLALSDNGPQMTSGSTREFMALCAIHQHFGRPGTPTDQAWIESLFGHVKAEYPHLLAIGDPAALRAELAVVREHYNTVRLHASIGYVTPNHEHQGRGEQIRKAREAGLEQARLRRIAYHRASPATDPTVHPEHDPSQEPGDVG